jgi:hypothetical protein
MTTHEIQSFLSAPRPSSRFGDARPLASTPGGDLREYHRIALFRQPAHQPLFASGPPESGAASNNQKGRASQHLVNDLVRPVTHAEHHAYVDTHVSRERTLFIDESVPLLTRWIEPAGR